MAETKRTFGISVKRSKNYQSVEVHEGFEVDNVSNEVFDTLKQEVINRVNKEVKEQLAKQELFDLEV